MKWMILTPRGIQPSIFYKLIKIRAGEQFHKLGNLLKFTQVYSSEAAILNVFLQQKLNIVTIMERGGIANSITIHCDLLGYLVIEKCGLENNPAKIVFGQFCIIC